MAIFVWYPKERTDLKMIHDENDVLTDYELVVVRNFLKLLVLERVSIHSPNFVVKKSSHVTSEFSL